MRTRSIARTLILGTAGLLAAGWLAAEPARPGDFRGGFEPRRSDLRQAVETHRMGRDAVPMPMPERRLSPQEHAELREQLRLSAERRAAQGRR